jgi:hypothetical protein
VKVLHSFWQNMGWVVLQFGWLFPKTHLVTLVLRHCLWKCFNRFHFVTSHHIPGPTGS